MSPFQGYDSGGKFNSAVASMRPTEALASVKF